MVGLVAPGYRLQSLSDSENRPGTEGPYSGSNVWSDGQVSLGTNIERHIALVQIVDPGVGCKVSLVLDDKGPTSKACHCSSRRGL